jgi:hypothetical protein
MKRALVLVALACALGAACTLLDRPTDYFDPDGGLVTLTVVPGTGPIPGLRTLVLTASAVFIATPSNVYRIDKTGGNLQTIDTSTAGDFASIASDATSRVAWCSQSNGITIWDDALGVVASRVSVATNRACETVAISPDLFAYTAADEDDAQARHLVFTIADGSASDYPLLDGSGVAPIAFTEDDTYYVGERNALVREILPSDDPSGKLVGSPECFLGGGVGVANEIVASGDAGLVFYLNESEARFTSVVAPCCGADQDAGCTIGLLRSASLTAPLLRLALHGSDLWRVGSTNGMADIVRESLATDASDTVRTGLGNAVDLAVDDAHAFFLVGDKLQSVPW